MSTIKWILIVISVVFISSLFLPLALILKWTGAKKAAKNYTAWYVNTWAKAVLKILGLKLEIEGLENLPKDDNICIVSNHQGSLDFFIIMAAIPKQIGFIAKKSLSYIPIMNIWMYMMECKFIDRKRKEKSIKTIRDRANKIHEGYPMLIFPEGTRSRSKQMNPFKASGLRTIINAKVDIFPITMVNSFAMQNNGKLKNGKVKVVFHPIMPTADVQAFDQKTFVLDVEKQVAAPLQD